MTRTSSRNSTQADRDVTVRRARAQDAHALARLAALDSARALEGSVLLAEECGSVVAAVSLDDGRVIADPFRATAEFVEVLRLRRAQLELPRASRPVGLASRLRTVGASLRAH